MQNDYEIEIVDTEATDGGIVIFARAWLNGVQLGFGEDGSIDIERFRFYNPPILVDDPLGDIIQPATIDDVTGIQSPERRLREDPLEAIQQALVQTVALVGKDGANIIPGKRGNTTSTFYASHDAWTDVYDGSFESTFQLAVDWTGSGRVNTTATSNLVAGFYRNSPDGGYTCNRSFFTFDTAPTIASGDTISSATFSLYGSSKELRNTSPSDQATNIYGCNPGNPNSYVATDYGTILDTAFSTSITYTNWSTSGYNDFALDSNGIARIAKGGTGYTSYATSDATYDAANRVSSSAGDPSLGENSGTYVFSYFADQTGTANDPKLVVEHTAGGGVTTATFNTLLGVG